MQLGCIGDDFTGSSDLANTLAKGGMRVTQYTGVPEHAAQKNVQAGVVALKSRSIASADAVTQSLEALAWLRRQGCKQIFFKYCSTFDSTPAGNIGPVIDALASALESHQVIVCPAFPGAGRFLYQGHLFVHDRLLNESGMENHPLTPMKDADIRRWLAPQTTHCVGHISAQSVMAGSETIIRELHSQQEAGNRLVVVDAISDKDLLEIGRAAKGLALVTGGSGVALGLPENFGHQPASAPWAAQKGHSVVLSGSCSTTTRAQVAYHAQRHPVWEINVADVIENRLSPAELAEWLLAQQGIPLAFSSAEPAMVKDTQESFGQARSAKAIENFMAETARALVAGAVASIITAGGETSGAVVEGLALSQLEIGPEIDPGVPALRASENLVLALKSGNFGGEDFFEKASALLSGSAT